jgi:hypothetical protein
MTGKPAPSGPCTVRLGRGGADWAPDDQLEFEEHLPDWPTEVSMR